MSDQNNQFLYPKGSEWRKWDLHAHTPVDTNWINRPTLDTEEQKKKFAKQYADFANDQGLSVIAITDHNFCNKYDNLLIPYIKEEANKHNINILPGFEITAQDGSGIHLLVIFPEDTDLQKIFDVIQQLFPPSWERIPEGSSRNTIPCSDKALIKIKEKIEDAKLDAIFIFAHADRENGVLDQGTIQGTRRVQEWQRPFINICQLSKAPSEYDSDSFVYKVINGLDHYYKKRATYIIASDCRCICMPGEGRNEEGRHYLGQKFTWIKANPTFEGLKQILYEPDERVYIGEDPPSKIEPGKIIKCISFKDSNQWFIKEDILFNSDMVSIIGGRGTGKTALLDTIALAANKNWLEIEDNENSFLKKAHKNFPSLEITLTWMDSTKDIYKLTNTQLKESPELPKVTYLSQGFVTQLCSEEHISKLQDQIESVIYQKVKDEQKAIYTDFESYKKSQLDTIHRKRNQIQKQIQTISDKIKDTLDLILQKSELSLELSEKGKELSKIKAEIQSLSKSITDKSSQNQKHLDEYNQLNEKKLNLEKEIAKCGKEIREISALAEQFEILKDSIKDEVTEINDQLTSLNITPTLSVVLAPEDFQQILNKAHKTREEIIKEKTVQFNELKDQIKANMDKLKLEKTRQQKLTDLSTAEKKTEQDISSLTKTIDQCSNAEIILPQLKESQKNYFASFFITLFQEYTVLKEIYKPLEESLACRTEEEKSLFRFDVKLNFDYLKMAERGEKLIDHRCKGNFQNRDQRELIERLQVLQEKILDIDLTVPLWQDINGEFKLANENIQEIDAFISEVMNLFMINPATTQENNIKGQLNKNYSMADFYNWIYGTGCYTLSYSIEFDKKKLHELTPGLKGIALLILYLDLDESNRPILIDQPEENLDNRSAYTTLVNYFRNAKKKRQVIVATHNANLVVNTDSEQVIVANFSKDRSKQSTYLYYVSGALENSFEDADARSDLDSKGIRQHCWYILEGGPEAFQKREEKYNFPQKKNIL